MAISILIGTLVGSLYSLNFVFLIFSLVLLYKIISPMLVATIFNSHFFRSFVTLFLYVILLQATIVAAWLLTKGFSLNASIGLVFGLLLFSYLASSKLNKEKRIKRTQLPLMHRSDVVAIVLSLLILVPVVSYSLSKGGTSNVVSTLSTNGADDAYHLKQFNARIIYDRGVLYGTLDTEKSLIYGDMYPAGWYSTNAVIAQAFYPPLSAGAESQIAYIISKLFWMLALLFIFCRAIISLWKKLAKDKSSLLVVTWTMISTYIFGRIFVIDVYPAGAYTFVPQLIAAILTILILLQLSQAKLASARRDGLFLLAMVAIGGCLSWILVLPALFVGVVIVALLQRKEVGNWSVIRALFTKLPYSLFLYILVTGFIVQLYIMFTSRALGALSFIESINLNGGQLVGGLGFNIFITVGLVTCLVFLYKKYHSYFHYLTWIIVPLFIFSQIISIVQLTTVGENRYYFFKILNLLTMFLIPLCIIGYMFLIQWLQTNKSKVAALCLFIILSAVSSIFLINSLLHIF